MYGPDPRSEIADVPTSPCPPLDNLGFSPSTLNTWLDAPVPSSSSSNGPTTTTLTTRGLCPGGSVVWAGPKFDRTHWSRTGGPVAVQFNLIYFWVRLGPGPLRCPSLSRLPVRETIPGPLLNKNSCLAVGTQIISFRSDDLLVPKRPAFRCDWWGRLVSPSTGPKLRSFSHFLFLRHRIICWSEPLPKG